MDPHRGTGPVSFKGAEISCPNIFSISCPKNQVVLPEYYFLFCPKMANLVRLCGSQILEGNFSHVAFNSIIFACKYYKLGTFTLAKTKIQKTWVFCCTVYTARKTHNIQGFLHEKCMREKTRISYLCFGKWCACATSLYL